MNSQNQEHVVESYRMSFQQHGDAPEALQWSVEGQRWRFDKLLDIAAQTTGQSLLGKRILEIGCGLGHLYPVLQAEIGAVDYYGIDIVPELIARAKEKFPGANFECRDIFQSPLLQGEFDFVFISGVFNAPFRNDSQAFMSSMLQHAFAASRTALAFNFTSSHVNFISEDTNYFTPEWVLSEVLEKLSKKVQMDHHYRNCDVAVCVCR
ncbi:class I SAM-dependent methyltransferase [Laribacter hongkongensis]|uniref:Methyltransferase type 12 n=1 Tax=Laribacter hongkongensis TaxID=168471 RepID=A0A248LNA0_9NEIS|nr:class I SAM-dependent methyltransferase [Laribacter hongkongensis]ASJ25643.1 methyltransferase type 12 [Laribacter hongkongensis]MCG9040718.1 class I SAM-dependent methyltransferase [Laribacter hongkongensis]MCG9056246.1 class I SAM-dependent methyltransferase [Laribacter hongkongensis]MCG9067874.1 class I SAM-dependent methyltransferase [Laribacter hongkongensis]MCG9087448.1 class I SAM-dependent methyltransferase [Laribacter hongkongensis]